MELSLPFALSLSFSASPLPFSHMRTNTHTQVSERGFSCMSQSATNHCSERERERVKGGPLILSDRLFTSPPSLQNHAHLIIFFQPHYNNFLIYSKPQSQQQSHIQHTVTVTQKRVQHVNEEHTIQSCLIWSGCGNQQCSLHLAALQKWPRKMSLK